MVLVRTKTQCGQYHWGCGLLLIVIDALVFTYSLSHQHSDWKLTRMFYIQYIMKNWPCQHWFDAIDSVGTSLLCFMKQLMRDLRRSGPWHFVSWVANSGMAIKVVQSCTWIQIKGTHM